MIRLTYLKSHSHTMPSFIYSKIAQVCLGDDCSDITCNFTYLYGMKIGLDFHFFL